jgi:hypothetical protein
MVFEKRVLRRIFEQKTDGVVRGWRNLDDDFHTLYSSPSVSGMVKSRGMRWAWNAERMGGEEFM